MVKPRCVALLLVTALLALSFTQGFVDGRRVHVMRAVRQHGGRLLPEEMEATVMDYDWPKPNTNTRGGMLPPQDPPSPPAH